MQSSLTRLLSTAELLPAASTRRFYRTEKGVVLVGNKVQINEYLKFHKLLSDLDLPEIREQHDDYLVIEDLGPDRLDKIPDPPYEMMIDELIKWQEATGDKKEGLEVFSYSHLKWEYEYFLEYAVRRFFKIEPADPLIKELDDLTKRIDRLPKVLMHRDFQSRNIFIKNDQVRIIDFQNAMLGPATYDLASLLFDPYRPMPFDQTIDLLTYYNEHAELKFSTDDLFQSALQRLLQALGAYAFLTLIRVLDYEQYLKIGIRIMAGIINNLSMPFLRETINQISAS